MKTGIELLESLKADLQRQKATIKDRENRLDNQEIDLSDCFMSRHYAGLSLEDTKAKIKILENKGLESFEKLADLEGNITDGRLINTKYGECWLVNGVFISKKYGDCREGRKVWKDAGFQDSEDARAKNHELYSDLYWKAVNEGYKAKGYQLVFIELPAWVSDSGNIFESNINYWTGEQV